MSRLSNISVNPLHSSRLSFPRSIPPTSLGSTPPTTTYSAYHPPDPSAKMSARSTPRASTSHLPRTPSFSSDHSHDPSTSRRHTRTDSLRLPTLAESSVHSSGLSTPETRRRRYQAKKNNNVKQIEVDWAEVEPDEVFRRLPVQEVRRVEQKMRTDALNKQSELRAMVG
jgi:hypothetical protein